MGETLEYLSLPLRRAQVDKMDTHYIFEMKEGDLSVDERAGRSERRQRKRGRERQGEIERPKVSDVYGY